MRESPSEEGDSPSEEEESSSEEAETSPEEDDSAGAATDLSLSEEGESGGPGQALYRHFEGLTRARLR